MSLRPGLLASTSRSALAALRPTAAAAPRAAIARAQYARLQSTSSKSRPEEQEGTVQHMDKLLKEREKAMKSLPRGIEGFGAPDDLVLGESRRQLRGQGGEGSGKRMRMMMRHNRELTRITLRRPTNVGQAGVAPPADGVLEVAQGAVPALQRHAAVVSRVASPDTFPSPR